MVLDLSKKQIEVFYLQTMQRIWDRGSGIDNVRQENFYCLLCITLWQCFWPACVLKGIWDWMPCTNTMCQTLQPFHSEKLFERAAERNIPKPWSLTLSRPVATAHSWSARQQLKLQVHKTEREIQTYISDNSVQECIPVRLLTKVAFIFLIAGGIYHGEFPGAQSRERSRRTSVTI